MGEFDSVQRDIASIRLPEWGRVVAVDDGVVPFVVVDPDRRPVEPIRRFLRRDLGALRRDLWRLGVPGNDQPDHRQGDRGDERLGGAATG
jgi:hypothetical protein